MQANHSLPPGTQLENYEIQHVLNIGGFSIVYLAKDLRDGNTVVNVDDAASDPGSPFDLLQFRMRVNIAG